MINFGVGKVIATPTHLADGSAIAVPTPVVLANLQDVSVDLSVDLKELYAAAMYPVAIAQGKAKAEMKAKYAEISAAVLGALFFGQAPSAGIKAAVMDFAATVPAASAYTIAVVPPYAGSYVDNLGVTDANTGEPLTRVSAAPMTDQYSVSALGIYTFASEDAGRRVLLNYEYSASDTRGKVFNITNRVMGYTPSFSVLLQTSYDGKTLTAKFNRGVSGKLSLPMKSEDFTTSDFEAKFFADAAGNVGYLALS